MTAVCLDYMIGKIFLGWIKHKAQDKTHCPLNENTKEQENIFVIREKQDTNVCKTLSSQK